MDSIQGNDLVIKLEQLSDDLVERHHLQGLVYKEFKKPQFKSEWKKRLQKNQLIGVELAQLGQDLEDLSLSVSLLKGFALLGDVYEDWGARFASDVDLLVAPKDYEKLSVVLKENGFVYCNEDKWQANNFKSIFIKATPLFEITLEVHTRLFWHTDLNEQQLTKSSIYSGFKKLCIEDGLIHLCGHLAFQHTFIKLFWLFDIQYFLEKHGEKIHWETFWNKAVESQLFYSCCLCLWLTGHDNRLPKKGEDLRFLLLKWLCHQSFLLRPRKHPVRYFLIKTLLKEPLSLNFIYNLGWVKNKYLKMRANT